MTRKQLALIAALAVMSTGAAAVAVQAGGPRPDPAASLILPAHAGSWHQGWRGGWGRNDAGPGFMGLCGPRREARLDGVLAFAETYLDLGPGQQEAWARLQEAARAGSARVGDACAELEQAGAEVTPPGRLARMETMLSAGLAAVQEVRPAFETLYGQLTEEQRVALDELMSQRGRGGRG